MKNIIQYAYSCWIIQGNSPLALNEFREEYNKFIFVNRILKKYTTSNTINIRLLLNHFIVLYNTFGDNATGILFLTVDKKCWTELHSVLEFLNRIPIPPCVDLPILNSKLDLTNYPPSKEITKLLIEL